LQGPATDDEEAIVITKAHVVGTSGAFVADLDSDEQGNIYVAFGRAHNTAAIGGIARIAKYDTELEQAWLCELYVNPDAQLLGAEIVAIATSPSGGVSYTGTDGYDAVVGKVSAAGEIAWEHKWESSGKEIGRGVAISGNGSIYAAGTTTGQAPGNPPTNTAGPWLARYDDEGTRIWLKQFPVIQGEQPLRQQLFLDGAGGIYYVLGTSAIKWSEAGAEEFRTVLPDVTSREGYHFSYGRLGFERSHEQLFGWGPFRPEDPTQSTLAHRLTLSVYDANLALLWTRSGELPRSAIVEPVEGVTWTGSYGGKGDALWAGGQQAMVVGSDAVYVVGVYRNDYANGAVPRPSTNPTFVARYDLTGERVWFRQFRFEGSNGEVTDPMNSILERADMVLDADGNPVIGINTDKQSFLFRLNAADGTVL